MMVTISPSPLRKMPVAHWPTGGRARYAQKPPKLAKEGNPAGKENRLAVVNKKEKGESVACSAIAESVTFVELVYCSRFGGCMCYWYGGGWAGACGDNCGSRASCCCSWCLMSDGGAWRCKCGGSCCGCTGLSRLICEAGLSNCDVLEARPCIC
jgi:hypothetical protein